MFVWQIMMGGDRLPDLGWEVRSAGGRWFLSIGELHAAKRVMTWSYGGIFHSATSPCVHVQVLFFFFNPQSSRNRQQFFKRVIYRRLWFAGRDGETDSVEFGKDNGSRYNISPDLALSSSFILHTLPRALPLLHTQCQSPQPICQTFQRAPPVPCQPLGMGWFPCEKPQGQWLYELGFTSLPKANPGQCRMLAEQLVGWGGCWGPAELCCHPWRLHTSSVLTRAHLWASALLCRQQRLVALWKFLSYISLCCSRVIPDLHTGAAEKRRIRLITLLTPLLLKGPFLWNCLVLLFQAVTTLLVSQPLPSPTNAIPIPWVQKERGLWIEFIISKNQLAPHKSSR